LPVRIPALAGVERTIAIQLAIEVAEGVLDEIAGLVTAAYAGPTNLVTVEALITVLAGKSGRRSG
jgi:hypothetical protein